MLLVDVRQTAERRVSMLPGAIKMPAGVLRRLPRRSLVAVQGGKEDPSTEAQSTCLWCCEVATTSLAAGPRFGRTRRWRPARS